jgi:hypothetical protein
MAGDPAQIIAAVGCFSVIGFVVLGPIGRAFADRLRGKHRDAALDSGEVEALRDELHSVRQQVAELAERQDFAERLLAQARDKGLLSAPKEPKDK